VVIVIDIEQRVFDFCDDWDFQVMTRRDEFVAALAVEDVFGDKVALRVTVLASLGRGNVNNLYLLLKVIIIISIYLKLVLFLFRALLFLFVVTKEGERDSKSSAGALFQRRALNVSIDETDVINEIMNTHT